MYGFWDQAFIDASRLQKMGNPQVSTELKIENTTQYNRHKNDMIVTRVARRFAYNVKIRELRTLGKDGRYSARSAVAVAV